MTKHLNEKLLFKRICDRCKKELVPKLEVGPKNAFLLHKMINFILNIIYPKDRKNAYMKKYNTTIGYTIALATSHGEDVDQFYIWRTLSHEVKHALQAKKWTRLLFGYLYLWPISQGVIFLLVGWIGALVITSILWKIIYLSIWLTLVGIHFIPQIPDPWRSRWELQAYTISMHLRFHVTDEIPDWYIDHLVDSFSSMMYYMMEPNKKKIKAKLQEIAEQIEQKKSPVKDDPIIKIVEEEYNKLLNDED